ncbi:MAG TPA: NAD(P)-dependent oxidoreductase [Burkholderiaceae bacterium]|jgi:nucleoside-diphosphate-sugar epimerase
MHHDAISRSAQQREIIDLGLVPVLTHLNTSALAVLAGTNIFITGGTGFFGLWLLSALDHLNRQGARIRATVLSRDPARFLQSQPYWATRDWLAFHRGNVRDFAFPQERYDLLIHAATDTSVAAQANPMEIFADIVDGTRHVLDFAVQSGIKRTLLTSSGAVYGPQPADISHITEDARFACAPESAASAYGEAKRAMELLGTLYHAKYGLESVIARCFAFAGPGLPLDGHFAIGNFINDALYADAIMVKGDGTPLRSYLYGADLSVWLLTLLAIGKPAYPYNVGSDQAVSIAGLADTVRDVVAPEKTCNISARPVQGAARQQYLPAIERCRNELGLDVWTPLKRAIELAAAYCRIEQRNALPVATMNQPGWK